MSSILLWLLLLLCWPVVYAKLDLYLQVNAESFAQIYVNGIYQISATNKNTYVSTVAPLRPGDNIIAIKANCTTSTPALFAFWIVSDYTMSDVTDATWKYSLTVPSNDWIQINYSDTSWLQSKDYGPFYMSGRTVSGWTVPYAGRIWSPSTTDKTVYFRKFIRMPVSDSSLQWIRPLGAMSQATSQSAAIYDSSRNKIWMIGGYRADNTQTRSIQYWDVQQNTTGLDYTLPAANGLNPFGLALSNDRLSYTSSSGMCQHPIGTDSLLCPQNWEWPSASDQISLVANTDQPSIIYAITKTGQFWVVDTSNSNENWLSGLPSTRGKGRSVCAVYWNKWVYAIGVGGSFPTIRTERISVTGKTINGGWMDWGSPTQLSNSATSTFLCQPYGNSVFIIQTTDLSKENSSFPQTFDHRLTTQIFVYNMETGDYQPTSITLPTDRMWGTSAIANGQLYVLNGYTISLSGVTTVSNIVEISNQMSLPTSLPTYLYFKLIADNSARVFVNGQLVLTTSDWRKWTSIRVPMNRGNNVIAINVTTPGPGGLLGYWSVSEWSLCGETDTSWKFFSGTTLPADWTSANFLENNAWKSAASKGAYGTGPWGYCSSGWYNFNATWIWSSTSTAKIVYFRKTIWIPTLSPTKAPTYSPTSSPTLPTHNPTEVPTASPTRMPTRPTTSPTTPTQMPTHSPTSAPNRMPTRRPTPHPSSNPTFFPTNSPTFVPTNNPSTAPTSLPSMSPTSFPSSIPTSFPSSLPTSFPSSVPTSPPTQSPIKSSTALDCSISGTPGCPETTAVLQTDSNNKKFNWSSTLIMIIIISLLGSGCVLFMILYFRSRLKKKQQVFADAQRALAAPNPGETEVALSDVPAAVFLNAAGPTPEGPQDKKFEKVMSLSSIDMDDAIVSGQQPGTNELDTGFKNEEEGRRASKFRRATASHSKSSSELYMPDAEEGEGVVTSPQGESPLDPPENLAENPLPPLPPLRGSSVPKGPSVSRPPPLPPIPQADAYLETPVEDLQAYSTGGNMGLPVPQENDDDDEEEEEEEEVVVPVAGKLLSSSKGQDKPFKQ